MTVCAPARRRAGAPFVLFIAALIACAVPTWAEARAPRNAATATAKPKDVERAIKAQLTGASGELAQVYRQRKNRPIWVLRSEGQELAQALAARDGRYAALAAETLSSPRDARALAQLELKLSAAYAEAAAAPRGALAFVDPQLAGMGAGAAALAEAARARDPSGAAERRLNARNPFEVGLEAALERHRETWSQLPAVAVPAGGELGPGASGPRVAALRARLGLPRKGRFDEELAGRVAEFQAAHGLTPSGRADAETVRALNRGPAHYGRLLSANLERARTLPADLGPRYILVDAAGGLLWYFEDGEPRLSMKVVVGRPDAQTPMMAGLLRYLIFNPYWNVPEDLVRTSIAPKVLAQGMTYANDFEVRPDYDERAPILDPAKIDWRAVQRGKREVWVRQKPGPDNMMGRVKLMLPNPLGIYLHDTPMRDDFAKAERVASSGCVRLEDAVALVELLVGRRTAERALAPGGAGGERRVDLKEPVPVYITYFTAMPTDEGVTFRPDIYGRDGRRTAGLGKP